MDVGYYISELLGQHGDVNVPGLGYFAHTRVNGYYNDREGKFYPPGYSVQFDPQYLDDDALAIHIAEKKKISVASSKYFTEKFVLTLKQQAAIGETALADLGWFTMYNLQLIFRPNSVTSTDPEFFGYPTIKLHKLGKQSVIEHHEPGEPTYSPDAAAQPQYNPQPYIPGEQYQTEEEQEEYLIELTRKKRRKTTWVFILLTLITTALAVYMVKRYDPESFKFSFGSKEKEPAKAPIILETIDTGKTKADTDSVSMIRNIKPDSATSTAIAAPVKEVSSLQRYEVIAGSFKSLAQAGKAILMFKIAGLDSAKIVPDAPGRRFKVSVGTFITKEKADALKQSLITAKKIKPDSYTLPINPKIVVKQPR
ncbi:HU domain-containing protein [Mucilaginibacter gilvus]|uniref:SPOR domain-containing protein n=1 Tax=Mucilaginibacter gilvus TaxID=2305909 RepID=A0A444MUD3_9SPHI|nr:SPOR domain-containing protein [Mucilaginibacter gilvus]RWY57221.1 SPOR domain-containing protein [Mucilaginibacter gilvus]